MSGRRAPATAGAPADRGFTLLEVVVALAILSVAVVAGIQLFAGGLRLLKLAGEHQEATLIADAKAREVSEFAEGHDSGTDGDFTWERTISRTDVPVELATTTSRPYELYAVTVRVSWDRQRTVEITTLRTAHPSAPGDTTTQPRNP
jgi:prepilin-type N-terminal cleavage/methylation domain-containing protein